MISYENVRAIHFELSTYCNARCPNCPRNVDGGYNSPYLIQTSITTEKFKKIIDSKFLKQLEMFNFCGNYGDPILCKDLPQIIDYIAEINQSCYVEIHTNGGVRDAKWWETLAKSCNKLNNYKLVFSIDGLEDTNHIYRRDVVWTKLIDNVKTFISAGGFAAWEFLIFKHNEHQIVEAMQLASDLGFKEFAKKRAFGFEINDEWYNSMRVIDSNGKFEYYIYEPSDDNNKNRVTSIGLVDKTRMAYDMPKEIFKKIKDEHNTHFTDIYRKNYGNRTSDCIVCHTTVSKEIYIDAQGYVFPCCWLGHASQDVQPNIESIQFVKWLEKHVDKKDINALITPIENILNSDYFKQIQNTWNSSEENPTIQTCITMCNKQNIKQKLYMDN